MQSTACCGLESSRVTKSGHSTPTGQQCWQQPLRFTTEKRPVQRSPAHGSACPAGSDVYESTGSPDVRTAAKRGSGVSADRQGRAGLRLCPTDGCELAHGKQPFPLSTHRTPRPRQGRFRHPSTHLSRQPAGQESKRARPPPPHGCLGTALGSASQRAWQHTGPAGPAASPRGSTCVWRPPQRDLRWHGLNSGTPKVSRCGLQTGKTHPGALVRPGPSPQASLRR